MRIDTRRALQKMLVLLVGAIVAGSGFARPLVIATLESDIQSLDPQFGGTVSSEGPILDLIFNGLVRFPPGTIDLASMEPDIAESWSHNEDFTEWQFALRPGVLFHAGYGELKASDVKFSLERNLTETSPWRGSYQGITEILTPDAYTVVIRLDAPDPFFLLNVNNYRGGAIVSQRAVEELGANFRHNPIGTGPFAFTSYQPRDRVVLTANVDYFRGAPLLEGVEVRLMPDQNSRSIALRRGAVDVIVSDPNQSFVESLTRGGDFEIVRVGPGIPFFLYINQTKAGLDNLSVRQAISHAINRNDVVELLGADIAVPIVSPIAPGYFGQTDDVRIYDYNPDEAKRLLSAAGYDSGLDMHVVISELGGYLDVMTLIQEQLRQVGIRVDLEVVDHASWHTAIRNDESSLVLYSFARPPTAAVVLDQFFASSAIVGKPTAITNFIHYESIDNLLEQARSATTEEQEAIYAEAQRRIMDDAVVVPLANPYWILVKPTALDLGLSAYGSLDSLNYALPINETTPAIE